MNYISEFHFPSQTEEEYYLDIKCWQTSMSCFNSVYPFRIFPTMKLSTLSFDTPITILYGGNGSGKTTALNVISEKLKLNREALYNKAAYMETYLKICDFELENEIPTNSRMIASDDVFNYMLNLRAVNQDINFKRNELFNEYNKVKYEKGTTAIRHVDYEDENSVAEFERNMSILKSSKNQFVRKNLMTNIREHSNGESALMYFQEKIESNALYLLDEPENSLSPEKQILLAQFIEDTAWAWNCQFIIATHSPFLLAMNRTKIYDLDEYPVCVKKWTELRNVQEYRKFFKEHEKEFKQVLLMDLFAKLNDRQTLAIQNTESYVKAIAGAGSEITKLLVSRYAYLVKK